MMTKTAIMIPILRKFSGVIIGVLKFGGDYNDLNVSFATTNHHKHTP